MTKRSVALLAVFGCMVVPAAAQGHVSMHPNTLPAGSYPSIALNVPSEESSANTVKVAIKFPPGFIGATPAAVPGWTAKVSTTKLAQPVQTDEGPVTDQVNEVVWSGGKIPPEHFMQFPMSVTVPDGDAGKTLAFKTVQTYDNGKVSRWIGPPSSDEPAPTVNVTAKGGLVEDQAGTEAGPGTAAASQPATAANSSDDSDDSASKGLGIAALAVGIAALIAAVAAIVMVGRRSRSGQ